MKDMKPGQNADQDVRDQLKMQAAQNIQRGMRLFVMAIGRMFAEAWIVQLIWNWVVVGHTSATELTYWEAFCGMVMVRILMGQIKISPMTFDSKAKAEKEPEKK